MKQPIKQMLTALAICGVIIATGFTLIGIGTAMERQAAQEHKTAPVIVIVCEAATVETLHYYDSVPLDQDLQDYIIRECDAKGIDPAIVMAMIDRESEYKADTIGDNGNSFGLMQIQPKWHTERMERLGCTDLLDPYHNVRVGVDYLCEMLNKYGDMAKALVAYNQGQYKGTITEYATDVLEKAERIGERNVYTR